MDKAQIYLQTEICILVNIKMVNLMEKANILGKMGRYLLGNLEMDLNMEKGNGGAVKGLNVIRMKENINKTRSMDMECSIGLVGMFIKGNIKKMKEMVSEKCVGQTAVFIKEYGLAEYSMGWVRWCFQVVT